MGCGGECVVMLVLESLTIICSRITFFQVEGKSLHVGGIRPYYTAQFNLFQHIGTVSSLRQTGMGAFPGCKADLSPVLWEWFVHVSFLRVKFRIILSFIAAKNLRATAKISRLAEEYVIN